MFFFFQIYSPLEMYKNISNENLLVSQVVGTLRNKETEPAEFRFNLQKLGTYLAYEAARYFDHVEEKVETPLGVAEVRKIRDNIVVVAILRAALPMAEGVINQFSRASMGVVSASRGKMLREGGKEFRIDVPYINIPYLDESNVAIIVDPMLASGSTMLFILDHLYQQKPKKIVVLSAIASEYGINRILDKYPETIILTGDIDKELNEKGYIVPGLGDAGDRAFNT